MDEASSKVVLDKTRRSARRNVWSWTRWMRAPAAAAACPPRGRGGARSQLLGGPHVTADGCQVTPPGLRLPELVIHTHHSQLQEPRGRGFRKEGENTFSSLSSTLTHFQREDPGAASLSHQAAFFPAVCSGWPSGHPLPNPPQSVVSSSWESDAFTAPAGNSQQFSLGTTPSSRGFHSGTLGLAAGLDHGPRNPTESRPLEEGPSKPWHLRSTLPRDVVR